MKELIDKYIGGVQKHRLKIETLTPVAIRNGEILSPLTDYHIEGNRLYLLDTDKLMADIDQNNWLDDFESKVLEYSGNHSGGTETNAKKKNRFIADFLKEKGASIKSYLKEENARNCQLKSEAEWVQLYSTIKTENKAYIPGSSIKGAIRTAIMYQWLTDTEEGKEKLASFLDTKQTDINSWVENIEKKKESRFKAKDNVEKKDEITKELRKEETERKAELLKLLHEFEEEVANVVFGKSEGEYNASTYFKISDSHTFKISDLRIASLQKKYREDEELKGKRKKEFTTSLQEFIDKGKETVTEIFVSNLSLDWRENRGCTYFAKCIKERKQLDKVFEAINTLSRDFLEFEILRLNAFKEGEKSKTSYSKENLNIYQNMLENLYSQLKENNLNSAITCIGFGKSIFMNTVLLAIRMQDKDIFTNIVKILHASHPKAEHFPFSYYATSIDSQDYPLGWVKITDVNKDAYQQKYDLPNFERANLEKDSIIRGVLLDREPQPKVQVSIEGVKQTINASGLSKFEKRNGVALQIGTICSFQIVAIKDGVIKDIKIIEV
ncbi:type III-A CRISPR-associated RAMP protein Csm5 [Tannerella forsythia]|uniref:type III-A CRISPR-associated RAMP protein Csm5 n=1 Tax=Tannerella forsythia TaxID=28112 RepID=UPI0028E4EFD2|nr:type III-A CRISPR-associated RAMP protein Csm5 [Tannerella forsythia]